VHIYSYAHNTYIHIHITYIHIHIHTDIITTTPPTYIYTCIYTIYIQIKTCLQQDRIHTYNTYMHTYTHIFMYTYRHVYNKIAYIHIIHTYIHIHIYSYIHTDIFHQDRIHTYNTYIHIHIYSCIHTDIFTTRSRVF
jgi:hypothetical protein